MRGGRDRADASDELHHTRETRVTSTHESSWISLALADRTLLFRSKINVRPINEAAAERDAYLRKARYIFKRACVQLLSPISFYAADYHICIQPCTNAHQKRGCIVFIIKYRRAISRSPTLCSLRRSTCKVLLMCLLLFSRYDIAHTSPLLWNKKYYASQMDFQIMSEHIIRLVSIQSQMLLIVSTSADIDVTQNAVV